MLMSFCSLMNTSWAPAWIIRAEDEYGNQIIRDRFVSMTPLPGVQSAFEPITLKIPCGTEKEIKEYQDKLDEVCYVYLSLQYRYGWSIKTTEKWHLKSTKIESVSLEGKDNLTLSFEMAYNVIDHQLKEKAEPAKPTKTARQKRVERMKRLFLK